MREGIDKWRIEPDLHQIIPLAITQGLREVLLEVTH